MVPRVTSRAEWQVGEDREGVGALKCQQNNSKVARINPILAAHRFKRFPEWQVSEGP